MPFSKGEKIFALVFVVSFAIMLIWAYRSDMKMIRIYYKNSWKVILSIAIILSLLVYLIKWTHHR